MAVTQTINDIPVVHEDESLPAFPEIAKQTRIEPAIECSNRVGLNIFHRILYVRQRENVFFSPFALCTALACIYSGSRRTTAGEIEHFFQVDRAKFPKVLENFKKTIKEMEQIPGCKISISNGLYSRKGLRIKPEFAKNVAENFNCHTEELDFVENSELARRRINRQVATQTGGCVTHVLHTGDVTSPTRLAMINLIHLGSSFTGGSDSISTVVRRFHFSADRQDVDTRMFARLGEYGFMNRKDLQLSAVQVPLLGGDTSFIIVIPTQINDFSLFTQREKLDLLTTVIPDSMVRTKDVLLCFPEFTKDSTSNLIDILYYMGLHELFSVEANLAAIFGQRTVPITEWYHRAIYDIRELNEQSGCGGGGNLDSQQGTPTGTSPLVITAGPRGSTESANNDHHKITKPLRSALRKSGDLEAAARVTRRRKSFTVRTSLPFVVDRPFLYYVLHHETRCILLMGCTRKVETVGKPAPVDPCLKANEARRFSDTT